MKYLQEIKRLFKDESAVSGVEYALILALIGVAIITAVSGLGDSSATKMQEAADNVNQN